MTWTEFFWEVNSFSDNEEILCFFMEPEDILQPLQKPATSYPKPG